MFRCNKKRCNCENNFLTPFQIGNWCSFLNIFNDIIKNNYKFVLICEDDIVFSFQHNRIINKLLSPQNFSNYKIKMNEPLLIRMGTAYNPDNHNSSANPIFLKNYSLCNPCFAINREMAVIYLKYLKIIDYHSDVYFHQKIPKNIKGVQYFTMYPYPVYELSFVKSMQKFESLVRPKNAFRRMEYKDFLFLSSNVLLNVFLKKILSSLNLDIRSNSMGFNGNIDYYVLLNEKEKERYFFQHKIMIMDDYDTDIKIIYYNLINNNKHAIDIYKLYIDKINNVFNLNLDIDLIINQKTELDSHALLKESIIIFYDNYLKLLDIENIIKININNDEDINKLMKIVNKNIVNKNITDYILCKKMILDNLDNSLTPSNIL